MCYLDEIVEARQDAVVAIHSLCDHRRELYLERLGGVRLQAAPGFQLVVSYNPGYQSILKDMKVSTRQRMVGIELDFPSREVECAVVQAETGVAPEIVERIVDMGQAIRRIQDSGLREVASTRLLITTAAMVRAGLPLRQAARAAIVAPLTDDRTLAAGLLKVVDAYSEGSTARS
jgi:nitric oxide reductase NorQ protein